MGLSVTRENSGSLGDQTFKLWAGLRAAKESYSIPNTGDSQSEVQPQRMI